jgi:uncharacterized protein
MHENALMWSDIMQAFADSPSQGRVVRFLLENGLGVSAEGRIVCNRIAIPATQVAAAVGVDRRVVDATAKRILDDPRLAPIFGRMRATPDLSNVAEDMGLSVVTITPNDARARGIVASAVHVLDQHDLAIRQIFVTDPYLAEEPKLVLIVDGILPHGVIDELRSLPQVHRIIL